MSIDMDDLLLKGRQEGKFLNIVSVEDLTVEFKNEADCLAFVQKIFDANLMDSVNKIKDLQVVVSISRTKEWKEKLK